MEIRGFEPLTPGLQSRCSSQLSYIPSPSTAQGKKESSMETVRKLKFSNSPRRIRFRAYTARTSSLGKGGDPAAPSGTTTLLRLHPPHKAYLRQRPPCGWTAGFGYPLLGWCDGRCVQGPGTYSPRRADVRLLAIPAS